MWGKFMLIRKSKLNCHAEYTKHLYWCKLLYRFFTAFRMTICLGCNCALLNIVLAIAAGTGRSRASVQAVVKALCSMSGKAGPKVTPLLKYP